MLDLVLYRIVPPVVTAAAGFMMGRYIFPAKPNEAEMREMLGLPAEKKAVKAASVPAPEAAVAVPTATPAEATDDGNFKDFRNLLAEIRDENEMRAAHMDIRFANLSQAIVAKAAAAAAATKAAIKAEAAEAAAPKKTTTPKPAAKKTATPEPAAKKTATPEPAAKKTAKAA